MDFLEDLFNIGNRNHGRKRQGGLFGHGDDDDDDHYDRRPMYRSDDDRRRTDDGAPCVNCSTVFSGSYNFCPNCGTPVARAKKCDSCIAEIAPGAKFCPSCGAKADSAVSLKP